MSHPLEETLLQYRFGTLDTETVAHVAEHLRTCSECTRAYARLGESIEQLRAYDVEATADEATLARALERATAAFEISAASRRRVPALDSAREARPPRKEPAATAPPPEPPEPAPGFWAWLGVQPGGSARPLRLAATAFLALSTTWLGGGALLFATRGPPLETRVSGESSLQAGGHGLLRLEVRRGAQGVPDAPFTVALVTGKGRLVLSEGHTNQAGEADVDLVMPYTNELSTQLEVSTRSGAEDDVVTVPLALQRSFKVHLATDKPLYQPGQTIHLRSLVMRSPRPEPASDKQVLFEVRDARNVRLASKSVPVSAFGVASFDLELSDDVALGTWTLTAAVDGTVADAQVEVSRYTLPKFKLAVSPDKETYLAGERLKARVTARYFFGKPVAGAEVRTLVTRENGAVLAELKGKTDADGTLTVMTELPSTLAAAGRPEAVVLQLEAKDAAGQQEHTERAVTISRELLLVDVLAEGTAVTGVENSFFVVTTTPDGRPVPAKVEVTPIALDASRNLFAPAPPSTTSSSNVRVKGPMKKELAERVVQVRSNELQSCHRRAPEVTGQVTLELVINTMGRVESAKTRASNLNSAALESCFLLLAKNWRFPQSPGANSVITAALTVGTPKPAIVSPPPSRPPAKPVGETLVVRTAEDGIGRFTYSPQEYAVAFEVKVEDAEGRRATREVELSTRAGALLTTDKAFYRPGETVKAELRGLRPQARAVVEARSEGRLIQSVNVSASSALLAAASLTLPRDFVGTLELSAVTPPNAPSEPPGFYAKKERGPPEPLSVTRRVVVAEPSGLTVTMSTDKPTYRPGEPATLRFKVTDAQGKPKVAALGLSIVDESLFALTASKPALVRAFFLVERGLLAPRFGVNAGELAGATSWTGQQQVAGRLLLSLGAPPIAALAMPRYFESTVHAKLAQRAIDQRRWSSIAEVVAVPAAFLLVLVLVLTVAARASLATGAVALGVLALGAGWLGLPKEVLVVGGLPVALGALWITRDRDTRGRLSVFVFPALGFAVAFALWPSRQFARPELDLSPVVGSAPESKSLDRAQMKLELKKEANTGVSMKPEPSMAKAAISSLAAPGPLSAAPSIEAAEPPRREVRVRQHFPETLYVNPQLIADEKGVAELTLPLADSITAWRISALASSADGKLGTLDAPLKVFQSFFVDLDVPVALVRGDEATVPIALYNYLETAQDVRLEVEAQPWFELVGEAPRKLTLEPNGVAGASLRIRVKEPGEHQLTVRADGMSESDVVARQVLVTEAGREESVSVSGTVAGGQSTKVSLTVPEAATGATRVMVKLFPSLAATALDGIEGTLAQPTGCFEQTSATTYPNVLVEEFLRREGRLTPELERRTGRLLSLGYQQLVRFEVEGGGFEWFGRAPANQVLSAYGLMEFSDLRRVFPVDPQLIERTQRFLLSRQKPDGSWDVDRQMIADGLWRSEHRGRVTVTAYIAWALAESGLKVPALERAQAFLAENLDGSDDAYTLALMTAGFAKAGHPETARAAGLLAKKARKVDGLVAFTPAGATAYYGRGAAAEVETTALAAYALSKAGAERSLVKGSLDFLLARRKGHGAWPSTQGTILALKALLAGTEAKGVPQVSVSINGVAAGTFALTDSRPKVLTLGARAHKGLNVIELSSDLDAPFLATATYTLPWRQKGEDDGKPLALTVEYGTRKADVGGIVPVELQLTYRGTEASGMALVELGVPAGLTPLPEDLEALRAGKQVAKFQVSSGKVRLYLDKLQPGSALKLALRFKATMSVDTRGVGSLAYLYYDPAVRADAPAVAVAVR